MSFLGISCCPLSETGLGRPLVFLSMAFPALAKIACMVQAYLESMDLRFAGCKNCPLLGFFKDSYAAGACYQDRCGKFTLPDLRHLYVR